MPTYEIILQWIALIISYLALTRLFAPVSSLFIYDIAGCLPSSVHCHFDIQLLVFRFQVTRLLAFTL